MLKTEWKNVSGVVSELKLLIIHEVSYLPTGRYEEDLFSQVVLVLCKIRLRPAPQTEAVAGGMRSVTIPCSLIQPRVYEATTIIYSFVPAADPLTIMLVTAVQSGSMIVPT